MNPRQFVAVTGSGAIGWHPLHEGTWSGSSSAFFSLLQQRGQLWRAFGVEAPRLYKWSLMARHFHPDRKSWRKRFYTDTRYREALTTAVRRDIEQGDVEHDFIQIGAMFNTASAVDRKTRCFAYIDSNVAISMRSPYAPQHLPAAQLDRILEYERHVYHDMARIFTAGEYVRDSLIADFGVPADRIQVIGMGINLPSVPQPLVEKRYDEQEVLFLGADFDRKGGPVLLRAFQIVRDHLPGAHLHIVGPRHLRVESHLRSGVTFHGHLRKTDPQEWKQLEGLLRRCTLFVLPSLYEPFGIAPLEAMAYQMPCVVSNIQALREFVVPGVTGDIAAPGSVEDLAHKIDTLLGDASSLKRMGQAARALVLESYTWPRVVERFLQTVPPG